MSKNILKTSLFSILPISATVQTLPLDTLAVTSAANPLTGLRSSFEAQGIELETAYYWGDFSLNGDVTYTHSRIVKDELNPDNVGDPISPDLMHQFTPAYQAKHFNAGLNFIGNSDASTGKLVNPGYIQVNAFSGYEPFKGLWRSITGYNLFDTTGIAEITNNGRIFANSLNGARSINGLTIAATLRHSF